MKEWNTSLKNRTLGAVIARGRDNQYRTRCYNFNTLEQNALSCNLERRGRSANISQKIWIDDVSESITQ